MRRRRPLREGDVLPSNVLRDVYGRNAANRPTIRVDPEEVPVRLRHLIPYVERWAIPCDVTRIDYFDAQPAEDVVDLWRAVLPHRDALETWIEGHGHDVRTWPEAVGSFLYLLKAHDEARPQWPGQRAALEQRHSAQQRRWRKQRALVASVEAFRAKDWAAIVALLAPFERELEGAARARLAYARKHAGDGRADRA
jgi:hypothetical protein